MFPGGGLRWGPDTLVIPDLFVVDPSDAHATRWEEVKTLRLVIEILSPSTAHRQGRLVLKPVLRVWGLGLPAALLALQSCSSEMDAGQWFVDSLPGPTLVSRNTGPGAWHRRGIAPWLFTPATVVGRDSDQARDSVTFVDLVDLEVDAQGRAFLLDRGANEIRVFGPDGTPVRTIGRYGRGPGELNWAQGMTFDPSGRLWVLNQNNARYTVFDTSGVLLREYPYPLGSTRYTGWLGSFSPSGALFDWTWTQNGNSLVRRVAEYDTTTGNFVGTPTLIRWPVGPPLWLVTRTASLGWWAASAAEYRVYLLSFRGDTLRIVQRDDYQPVPLGPSHTGASAVPPVVTGGQVMEPPAYQRIAASIIEEASGHLWIAHWSPVESQRTMLDVFSPEGEFLGPVEVPYRLDGNPRPVIRGGRLYAVVRDENDVQSLVIFKLHRVGPF